MKLAFAGTPEFAATVLRGLLGSPHEVSLVVSQPDAPSGRGRKPVPPPVAELAREAGLPLVQPARISEAAPEIARHDALVVAAYGQLLRPDTLYAARHGAWNVHASLLPAYRGAAPVERAIMAGEDESGVSIMQMEEGLDSGPVALRRRTPVPPDMPGGELTRTLSHLGAKAVVEVMSLLEEGEVKPAEQDHASATYAPKITASDRDVRWDRPARAVHDHIRALSPHIGARAAHAAFPGPVKLLRSEVPDGGPDQLEPGEILAEGGRLLVGCSDGALEVLELQVPGARPMSAAAFLRGRDIRGRFGGV